VTFEPIRQELLIQAPPEVVWRNLREPDLIHEWHGWEDPGLDTEIQQLYVEHAIVEEEARSIVLGGHRIRLEPTDDVDGTEGGATVLQLTRTPPADDQAMDWEAIYDDVDEGWGTFLHTLQFRLERHPDDHRRTGFWWGRTIDEYGPRPVVALGLQVVDELRPGDAYEATLPGGDVLTGEVWFQTVHQVGVTVDSWGDGLLVVAESPSLHPPHAASMAGANCSGVDAADRDAAIKRLTDVWQAEFTAEPLPGET
jgi:uncharacterized protein YndB with AHSA1/START domain